MKIPRFVSPPKQINQVIQTDCVVVGAGIAGLYTALQMSQHAEVILLSKKSLIDSNTRWAQGGIAAVLSEVDTPELHMQDTLMAGAGLCNVQAVDVLVHEGPKEVKNLIHFGVMFDEENGQIALTMEGAHSRKRILHAKGDATGLEIVRGLSELVKQSNRITVLEEHFVAEIITNENQCKGIIALDPHQKEILIQAKATVLASGGAGQLYRYTTNPDIATGDGLALAYRAGAKIQDMEFIQFHPTVLFYPGAPRFLISEAVRGEGAILRNTHGEPFMHTYHPLADLAPRDVVSRAIVNEMNKSGNQYVYLDFTHEAEEKIKIRFPTIYRTCLEFGLNLVKDWIPVAPAAHYVMGGVKTNLFGETNISGLYACGEVACTGLHGANRLASNSLSEAIVFGTRIVEHICFHRLSMRLCMEDIWQWLDHIHSTPMGNLGIIPYQSLIELRLTLQKKMLHLAGLTRSEHSLSEMREYIETCLHESKKVTWQTREEMEYVNLLTCSLLVVTAALIRKESRGGHFRSDFPEVNNEEWLKHIILLRDQETGEMRERYIHVKPS